MKAIILAAGMGNRLKPLTNHTHKSLISFAKDTTILLHILTSLDQCSVIDEIIVVTGYFDEKIRESVRDYKINTPIKFIKNDFYKINNPLLSIYAAKSIIKNNNVVILNGDTIFHPSVIKDIFDNKTQHIQLAVSPLAHESDYEKMTVLSKNISLHDTDELIKVGRSINGNYESMGIVLIPTVKLRDKFLLALEKLYQQTKNQDYFWHDILNVLIEKNETIKTKSYKQKYWYEIDTPEDMDYFKTAQFKKIFS